MLKKVSKIPGSAPKLLGSFLAHLTLKFHEYPSKLFRLLHSFKHFTKLVIQSPGRLKKTENLYHTKCSCSKTCSLHLTDPWGAVGSWWTSTRGPTPDLSRCLSGEVTGELTQSILYIYVLTVGETHTSMERTCNRHTESSRANYCGKLPRSHRNY